MRTGLRKHQRHQAVSRAIGTTGDNVCDMEAQQRMLDAHTQRIERELKQRVTFTVCDHAPVYRCQDCGCGMRIPVYENGYCPKCHGHGVVRSIHYGDSYVCDDCKRDMGSTR